jgi:hypothetical protein
MEFSILKENKKNKETHFSVANQLKSSGEFNKQIEIGSILAMTFL